MARYELDRNERVIFLDSRHLDKSQERLIEAVLNKLTEERKQKITKTNRYTSLLLTAYESQSIESLKNLLFTKFIGMDVEGININRYLRDERW